jgi:O-antigen/teichoic acid export membrane protein
VSSRWATVPLRDRLGLGSAEGVVGTAGSFRRNALVLTAGTLTAQALPLVLYPVFTRIYAPAEFGVFATVSLFGSVAAILASGAYEYAILIAPSRRVASHVVAYSLLRSGIVLAAILLAILLAMLLMSDAVLMRLGVEAAVLRWLPVVPFMAAAVVICNCYSEWCVRNRYFGELSKLRIWQSSAIAAARLGLGLFVPTLNGFVAGDAVGKAASAARSGGMLWARDRPYLFIHTLTRVRTVARRYAHVARYALPDQLINTLGGSIHVLFFAAAFGTEQLGYVSLVLSVMYVPVTVVSSAVKDVFRQRASVEYANEGSCRGTYRRLLVPLFVLAVAGFGTFYAVSPTLFPLVLGPGWGVAGEYARILTPLFFWNFVSMSLGGVMQIAERTDVSLGWQIVSLVLTVAALLVGTRVLNDIVAALWWFSLARAAVYVLYMGLSYYYAERRPAAAASA